jgi:hypothetical protein
MVEAVRAMIFTPLLTNLEDWIFQPHTGGEREQGTGNREREDDFMVHFVLLYKLALLHKHNS